MGEVVSHVCGACGENHPHLLNISAIISTILVVFGGYISYISKKFTGFYKNKLFILKKSTATTL